MRGTKQRPKIFNSINREFKYIIKLFHLYCQGKSVVFITFDDKVFGYCEDKYCGGRPLRCCYGHSKYMGMPSWACLN